MKSNFHTYRCYISRGHDGAIVAYLIKSVGFFLESKPQQSSDALGNNKKRQIMVKIDKQNITRKLVLIIKANG